MLGRKMAEYTAAVCAGKPSFHITLIMDVSPNCDCHGENDAPILPNLGMLASFDPVALDQACIDLINVAEGNDSFVRRVAKLRGVHVLEHGEAIGLGSRVYRMVSLDK